MCMCLCIFLSSKMVPYTFLTFFQSIEFASFISMSTYVIMLTLVLLNLVTYFTKLRHLDIFILFSCCYQFSSVAQSCLTPWEPMNHSTPDLPVHNQLLESTETHIHWVSDAIQSSHPLYPLLFLLPIPPSIGVFSSESTLLMRWPKYWVSALASVLPMNTQDWSPLFIYW